MGSPIELSFAAKRPSKILAKTFWLQVETLQLCRGGWASAGFIDTTAPRAPVSAAQKFALSLSPTSLQNRATRHRSDCDQRQHNTRIGETLEPVCTAALNSTPPSPTRERQWPPPTLPRAGRPLRATQTRPRSSSRSTSTAAHSLPRPTLASRSPRAQTAMRRRPASPKSSASARASASSTTCCTPCPSMPAGVLR